MRELIKLLQEAKQEIPSWLEMIASESAFSMGRGGGRGGRGGRMGGGFGGRSSFGFRDMRSGSVGRGGSYGGGLGSGLGGFNNGPPAPDRPSGGAPSWW